MSYKSNINIIFNYKLITISLIIALLVISCDKPPEYPSIPVLTEVTQAIFVPGDTTGLGTEDTIKFAVYFRDGDGDLGLTETDIDVPYNEYNYVLDANGNKINKESVGAPAPTACNYLLIDGVEYLVEMNEPFNNFIVNFYTQNADGSFSLVELCIPYSGRFPPLYKEGRKEVLEGSIHYNIVSFFFPKGKVKFDVAVIDRALNKSNIIETPEIFIK